MTGRSPRNEVAGLRRVTGALERRRVTRAVSGRHSIALLGSLFVVLATGLAYALAQGNASPLDVFIAFGLSTGPGTVLVYLSYQLPDTDVDPHFYPVIGAWCFGSALVTAAALAFYHLQPAAGFLTQPARMILNLASLSSIAGYAIGFHDARARTRADDLGEYQRIVEPVDEGSTFYLTIPDSDGSGALGDQSDEGTTVAEGFDG